MLKLKAPDLPNGGAPGNRVIGAISAALTALKLLLLEGGKLMQRFDAEALWFTSSRNSKKYFREVLA